MKHAKNGLSVALVLMLMFGAAWCASRLSSAFMWSRPVCMCTVLSLEAVILVISHRLNKGKLTAKSVLGVVCLTCLSLALGIGLLSAGSYLIRSLRGEQLFTSFPWYTVLFFALLAVGPVILVTGIAWIILHLRERKRNIKDIRLLVQLLLMGTALWAALWTVFRIRHILVYPDAFNHPWPASFGYALVYFGPWLLIGGCVWYVLRQFEKKLTPEDLTDVPTEEPVTEQMPIRWKSVFRNGSLILIPLLAVAALMFCLWDTGYLTWNIGMVVCGCLNVCLMIGLSLWYLCYNQKRNTLGQMKTLVWILTAGTVIGAVAWGIWYSTQQLNESAHQASNLVYTLGLGFFGPLVLGEGIMLALLDRLPAVDVGEKKRFPALVLALLALLLYSQFTDLEYLNEIPLTVTHVTNSDPVTARPNTDLSQVVLTFRSDYDIHSIYDSSEVTEGDAIYMTFATSWRAYGALGEKTMGYSLYPEEEIRYIYVYEPGYGYRLVVVRNEFTGKWEFYE